MNNKSINFQDLYFSVIEGEDENGNQVLSEPIKLSDNGTINFVNTDKWEEY